MIFFFQSAAILAVVSKDHVNLLGVHCFAANSHFTDPLNMIFVSQDRKMSSPVSRPATFVFETFNLAISPKDPMLYFRDLSPLLSLHESLHCCLSRCAGYFSRYHLQLDVGVPGQTHIVSAAWKCLWHFVLSSLCPDTVAHKILPSI